VADVQITFTGTSNVDQAANEAKSALDELLATVAGLQTQLDALTPSTAAAEASLNQTGTAAAEANTHLAETTNHANETGGALNGMGRQASAAAQNVIGLAGEGLGPLSEAFSGATEAAVAFSETGLLGIAAAATAAIAVMGELGTEAGNLETQMMQISATLGITAEEADKLALRFEDVGSNAGILIRLGAQLSTVMSQYADSVAKGTAESLKARTIIEELGVSLTTENGLLRNQGEVLDEVLTKLGTMFDRTEAARIAAELFGSRMAGQVIPALNNWSAGSATVADQSERLGLGTQNVTENSIAYHTALTNLNIEMERLGVQILPPLIEALDRMATGLQRTENGVHSLWGATTDLIGSVPGLSKTLEVMVGIEAVAFAPITASALGLAYAVDQLTSSADRNANSMFHDITAIYNWGEAAAAAIAKASAPKKSDGPLSGFFDGVQAFVDEGTRAINGIPWDVFGRIEGSVHGGSGAGAAAKAQVESFAQAMIDALQNSELEKEFGAAGGKVLEAFGAALEDPTKAASIAPAITKLIDDAEKAGVPNAAELGANLINAIGDGLQTGDWNTIYDDMHALTDMLGPVAVEHAKAAKEIAKDQETLATDFATTAEAIQTATTAEADAMNKLAVDHQNAILKILAQERQAQQDFADLESQRTADAADAQSTRHQNAQDAYDQRHADEADALDTLAQTHQDNLDKIAEKELTAKTYAEYLKFEAEKTAENKRYAEAVAAEEKKVAKADEAAAKALAKQDADAAKALAKQEEHDRAALAKQIQHLHDQEDAENTAYLQRVSEQQRRYADELKRLEESYAKQEAALAKHMAEMAAIAATAGPGQIPAGGMRPITIDWSVPPDPASGDYWDSANQRWVDMRHPPLPGYASGTPYVPNDGPAMLHRGERVVPAALNRPGAGGNNGMEINFNGPVTLGGISTQDQIPQVMLSVRTALARTGVMR